MTPDPNPGLDPGLNPGPNPDPRRVPARADLAAAHLRGEVAAARYAEPTRLVVSLPVAPLTRRAQAEAPMESQLLYGEGFAAYEHDGEWAWGQAEADGYVGYLPRAALAPAGAPASHRVAALFTHVYPGSSLKARPLGWLTYGAQVAVAGVEAGFAVLEAGGHIPVQHLVPRAHLAPDWVAEAARFTGVPYLWGGRAPTGLDCSGLLQLALQAAGRDCPRDSDMQEAELGRTLAPGTPAMRGDLMFWKGHVGIMLDGTRMLHANAHHMAVAAEPLAAARTRILVAGGGPETRHARLDGAGGGD
ncbi:MAG TPA: C40 family peptidase [Thermohalobaculum sp.]|nr:C40 family peptidase [Thermohalobaculum sp.]